MDSGLGLGWLRERALAKRRVCHGLLDGLGVSVLCFSFELRAPGRAALASDRQSTIERLINRG
jgi:hypothetical protein